MVDLYALHADFPGSEAAASVRNKPYDRVRDLEAAWQRDIQDSRFIPYLQLHEYEAYLFSKIDELAFFYPDAEQALDRLTKLADSVKSPEHIDDGRKTAPSKRIIAELPEYAAAKTTVGPQAGELIGIAAIRQKCSHFNDWLTCLEQLGDTRC